MKLSDDTSLDIENNSLTFDKNTTIVAGGSIQVGGQFVSFSTDCVFAANHTYSFIGIGDHSISGTIPSLFIDDIELTSNADGSITLPIITLNGVQLQINGHILNIQGTLNIINPLTLQLTGDVVISADSTLKLGSVQTRDGELSSKTARLPSFISSLADIADIVKNKVIKNIRLKKILFFIFTHPY